MSRIPPNDPFAQSTVLSPEACRTACPPKSRRNVFSKILRAVSAVASAAVPVAGPAIGAITAAVDRERGGVAARFDGTSDTLRYLELQRAIERETRAFETASNVMKAQHDAAMSSIRNLKS